MPKKKESMMSSVEISLGILDWVNAEYSLAPSDGKINKYFQLVIWIWNLNLNGSWNKPQRSKDGAF